MPIYSFPMGAGGGGGGGSADGTDYVFTFSGTLDASQNNLIEKLSKRDAKQIQTFVVLLQEAPGAPGSVFRFLVAGVEVAVVTVPAGQEQATVTLGSPVSVPAGVVVEAEIVSVATIPGVTATMIARVN